MLRLHCALQTCNAAQSTTSEHFATKTRLDQIFCPWLIKYGGDRSPGSPYLILWLTCMSDRHVDRHDDIEVNLYQYIDMDMKKYADNSLLYGTAWHAL